MTCFGKYSKNFSSRFIFFLDLVFFVLYFKLLTSPLAFRFLFSTVVVRQKD